MPERRNTGFGRLQDLALRMKDADPQNANGWGEVGDFAAFLARNGRISKSAIDPMTEVAVPVEKSVYEFEHFKFDIGAHSLIVEGKKAHLTMQNFRLFKYLIERPKKSVGYGEIIDNVWDGEGSRKTIRVHIHHLRLAISSGRDIPETIETVRDFGYKFVAEEIEPEL